MSPGRRKLGNRQLSTYTKFKFLELLRVVNHVKQDHPRKPWGSGLLIHMSSTTSSTLIDSTHSTPTTQQKPVTLQDIVEEKKLVKMSTTSQSSTSLTLLGAIKLKGEENWLL